MSVENSTAPRIIPATKPEIRTPDATSAGAVKRPRIATEAPVLAVGLRVCVRADGSQFMTGQLHEAVLLPAGTVLEVRRVAARGDGPTHVVRCLMPAAAPSRTTLARPLPTT